MVNTEKLINAIVQTLDENEKLFRKHLSTSENRNHGKIEDFQKELAKNLCQIRLSKKPLSNNGCEYPLYENIDKLGTVKDRADIRQEILLNNTEYELIIEIDATRADQVAKKMMSRFCYAILNENKPIIYVALLYQGTKSMNSDECKKYFKMGDEVLRKINSSNILIGYIVDKEEQKDVRYVSECNKSFTFDDEKAFDSDLYRRYLEDHGVQSPASIDCYMLPHNKIYSSQLTKANRKKLLEFLLKNDVDNFRNNYGNIIDLKGKLTYWKKYHSYLKAKKVELGLNDEK